jgi:hypothetical protein
MSTVPYIFAAQYGNIPLAQLDANFANVKANVDYATAAGSATLATSATTATTATTATSATTAATVTANSQPNITSLGTLSSLSVAGNVNITGTLTAGNIKYTSNVFVGDLRGSVYADDSTIMVDAIDNSIGANAAVISGNTTTSNLSVSGITATNGLEIVAPNWVSFSANITANLSTTTSYNSYYANSAGLTLTLNMPANPVEGQITRIATSGDTMTLVAGTGNLNVSFAGSAAVGTVYKYIYFAESLRWIRSA